MSDVVGWSGRILFVIFIRILIVLFGDVYVADVSFLMKVLGIFRNEACMGLRLFNRNFFVTLHTVDVDCLLSCRYDGHFVIKRNIQVVLQGEKSIRL